MLFPSRVAIADSRSLTRAAEREHLALAASLDPEHFAAFCAAGRELLHSPDDTQMLKKAAKALGADVDAVGASVRALCHILVSSATAGRSADDLLEDAMAAVAEARRRHPAVPLVLVLSQAFLA